MHSRVKVEILSKRHLARRAATLVCRRGLGAERAMAVEEQAPHARRPAAPHIATESGV
jgi:hypothetical protein